MNLVSYERGLFRVFRYENSVFWTDTIWGIHIWELAKGFMGQLLSQPYFW